MIARRHRFHGYGSLKYVYNHGQTVRGPLFAIKFVTNPRRQDYRLAVVVSRKVSKSAVRRNRIRRRLFEAIRQSATQLNQPYDMVVTVFHESIIELPADQLANQVSKQLSAAGLTGAKRAIVESKPTRSN